METIVGGASKFKTTTTTTTPVHRDVASLQEIYMYSFEDDDLIFFADLT